MPDSEMLRETHGRPTCTVEVVPDEVDAGAELTITGRVSCPHGCDLSGCGVSIRDQDGAELARAELAAFDGEAYVTKTVALSAPLKAGGHVYWAVLTAHEKDGVAHDETSTAFSFTAMAHAASVNVWDLPSAIAAGDRFRLKVGIKCSAGCNLIGRNFSVFDHEGAQVGAGSLLDIWPGTGALYFAEIEAQAPRAIGYYRWQVEAPGSDAGAPHAAGSIAFGVSVVSAPDHEVTVAAFDSETQAPIKGAHVLLHPYRALTDETGMAKVKVAKGRYRLVVSGFRYIGYENMIDVAGDVTTRAELATEPEGLEDYR
jgi:hypothetical protein